MEGSKNGKESVCFQERIFLNSSALESGCVFGVLRLTLGSTPNVWLTARD